MQKYRKTRKIPVLHVGNRRKPEASTGKRSDHSCNISVVRIIKLDDPSSNVIRKLL